MQLPPRSSGSWWQAGRLSCARASGEQELCCDGECPCSWVFARLKGLCSEARCPARSLAARTLNQADAASTLSSHRHRHRTFGGGENGPTRWRRCAPLGHAGSKRWGYDADAQSGETVAVRVLLDGAAQPLSGRPRHPRGAGRQAAQRQVHVVTLSYSNWWGLRSKPVAEWHEFDQTLFSVHECGRASASAGAERPATQGRRPLPSCSRHRSCV